MRRFLSRLYRWCRRTLVRQHYFSDLTNRYDNWCRTKEYL